jgi:DNA-directed RNA polymerase specialized sigma24 family protein
MMNTSIFIASPLKKQTMRENELTQEGKGKEILNLSYTATEKSLRKRDMYSLALCKELSSQLVFNIYSVLDKNPIHELPNYIRMAAKNLVINHGMKTHSSREVPTDPFDMVILETNDGFTKLDVMIKDEYDDLDAYQLEIIRAAIGDKDYLMLEAHFRDGESYKIIADKMGLAVHIVANHINRARIKCQKLKEDGHITY